MPFGFTYQGTSMTKLTSGRKDAAATKRDAEYTVAKEKCDAFAGDAKSNCMNEAKARFDRS